MIPVGSKILPMEGYMAQDDLVLFGFWRSIASFRVRVGLRLKGLQFKERAVNLMGGAQFTPDFDAVNPAHAVPVLQGPGFRHAQSLAILEFLEERWPEPALLPQDADARAHARRLCLLTVADAHPLFTPRVRHHLSASFGASEVQIAEWARHFLAETARSYEALLTATQPRPFVLGATPGLADICIASHAVACGLFGLAIDKWPTFNKLVTTCMDVPEFGDSHPLRQPDAPLPT
jgi:maleylacetoacetate isomerase